MQVYRCYGLRLFIPVNKEVLLLSVQSKHPIRIPGFVSHEPGSGMF